MPLASEKSVLEQCLVKAQQRLNRAREQTDELLADLTQADINDILDRLSTIYKGNE